MNSRNLLEVQWLGLCTLRVQVRSLVRIPQALRCSQKKKTKNQNTPSGIIQTHHSTTYSHLQGPKTMSRVSLQDRSTYETNLQFCRQISWESLGSGICPGAARHRRKASSQCSPPASAGRSLQRPESRGMWASLQERSEPSTPMMPGQACGPAPFVPRAAYKKPSWPAPSCSVSSHAPVTQRSCFTKRETRNYRGEGLILQHILNKTLLLLQLIDYMTLGNFPQPLPLPLPKKKDRLGSPSLVQRKVTPKENTQEKDT